MELDELKSALQMLDQKLERDNRISFALLRHRKFEGTRRNLRPIFVGQVMQILWGIAVVLLAVLLWNTKPSALPVIVAGVLVHAYGIGSIVVAALVLSVVRRIDYAGSVLEVQEKLARVRRAYAISSIVAGLSWWYLWILFLMVLAGLSHINLYANAPSFVWISFAVGTLGICATVWLYVRSRKLPHTRLRRWVDDAWFGRSLQRAQAQLGEIRSFEEEI